MINATLTVHGFSFGLESDHPLTDEKKEFLVHTMERFSPQQIHILAEGRKYEPPLKIEVRQMGSTPDS